MLCTRKIHCQRMQVDGNCTNTCKFSPLNYFQVLEGNCKNCHLNKTCFDYNKNLWYPTACKSRIFSPWQVKKCFQQKLFCFIGDSRYEFFLENFFASIPFHEKNLSKQSTGTTLLQNTMLKEMIRQSNC